MFDNLQLKQLSSKQTKGAINEKCSGENFTEWPVKVKQNTNL